MGNSCSGRACPDPSSLPSPARGEGASASAQLWKRIPLMLLPQGRRGKRLVATGDAVPLTPARGEGARDSCRYWRVPLIPAFSRQGRRGKRLVATGDASPSSLPSPTSGRRGKSRGLPPSYASPYWRLATRPPHPCLLPPGEKGQETRRYWRRIPLIPAFSRQGEGEETRRYWRRVPLIPAFSGQGRRGRRLAAQWRAIRTHTI